ncbi:MAG: HAMP domain-containing histidine kinase [Eubacterium sp.]|nr:HAMP domain-containing histidine kinase [Eubacterium sp.]
MKKLRTRFILVAMLSMLAVLIIMIGGLNVMNYRQVISNGDRLTTMIEENGGQFPDMAPGGDRGQGGPGQNDGSQDKQPPKMDPKEGEANSPMGEEQYQTRYFTVTENDGTMTANVEHVSIVDQDGAKKYASAIQNFADGTGFSGIYRYRIVTQEDGSRLYIFVDCEQRLASFRSYLAISFGVSALGLVVVFILVFIFSGIVFKPVKESYQKQKQFITDASHELKTPLTIIEANTEVLEMDSGENEWTQSTHKQIDRMNHMVKEMVALTRMDEGTDESAWEVFSLSEALLDQKELYATQAQVAGLTLDFQVESPLTYRGNEANIRKLFGILMDNAMKYAREGSTVRVSLGRKSRKNILTFYNETDQVSKGSQDLLFERFYRSDASRNSATGGSGIGLAIAKSIVEDQGGKIHAMSEDGQSLEIRIIL